MRRGDAMACAVMVMISLSACGGSRVVARTNAASTARTPSPPPGAPATPGRADIVRAMGEVSSAVSACGRGERDDVRVTMVFESSGAFIEARIAPEYSWLSEQPGPGCVSEGSTYSCTRTRAPRPELDACVLDAVRAARVPPFTRPRFLVTYPFRVGH